MKRVTALFYVLSFCLVAFLTANQAYADDIGMFSVTNPNAHSQIFGTPARVPMPLKVGATFYTVEDITEYGKFAANTSFNIRDIRLGAVVEYTSLDSIYERLRTQWELAYSSLGFGFGAAYNLDMERFSEKQNGSWATHRILLGSYGRFPEYLMYSALLNVPLDSYHVSVYDLAVYWTLNSYTLYVEYEWNLGYSVQVGQELFFDSWGVECAYKYPGSRLYLGIAVWFESVSAFAGVSSVSRNYQGRILGIGYTRN